MMGHGARPGTSMDAMVADMRNRFLVAAVFSVPICCGRRSAASVLGLEVAGPVRAAR